MPAYDYLCDTCGHCFEKRQKMSDAAIESCPQCTGNVRRLIGGGAAAICKGSSHEFASGSKAQAMCGASGLCCGQSEACGDGMFCKN